MQLLFGLYEHGILVHQLPIFIFILGHTQMWYQCPSKRLFNTDLNDLFDSCVCVFVVLVLFGLLPAAMSWSDRYSESTQTPNLPPLVPGGKITLSLVFGGAALVILSEIVENIAHTQLLTMEVIIFSSSRLVSSYHMSQNISTSAS